MATLEQVEKLRERANVTYDEAREALNASGGDLLDALIYLEKQGKVIPPKNGGYYSSQQAAAGGNAGGAPEGGYNPPKGEGLGQIIRRFWRWLCKLFHQSNRNMFEVWRGNEVILSAPVSVLVILLIVGFWVVVPLLVAGLFLGCAYRFRGQDLEKTGVNNVMDSAARAAGKFKDEVIRPEETGPRDTEAAKKDSIDF